MSYRQKFSPSIGDLIIATIMSYRSSVQFHKIIQEREFARHKERSVRMTFSRLHQKGYLINTKGKWSLSKKGKLYNNKNLLFSYISSTYDKNQPSNTIISFDIPETNRIKRNWLRNQIKIFGYEMLQQSLWLGPGPLTSEFLKRLDDLEIRKNIKIFTINRKIF